MLKYTYWKFEIEIRDGDNYRTFIAKNIYKYIYLCSLPQMHVNDLARVES